MRKFNLPNESGCYPQTTPASRSGDPDQPCFPERSPSDREAGCFPESPARRRRRRAGSFDLLDLLDLFNSR
jgi:hypothetical protein